MNSRALLNPAEEAAAKAEASINDCIHQSKNFLLEAGAGAGKTYSLIRSLRYLIDELGIDLLRRHQQIACITYTNVATDEIKSRTDSHPAILPSTIHAFCWSLIKDFQPQLREKILQLPKWPEMLETVGKIGTRRIVYELGYRKVKEDQLSLGHNDILALTILLMEQAKFLDLFVARYPILFIDEYQDTNKEFADALISHFVSTGEGPLIGFFGDHWQKIYGDGCGKIECPNLTVIEKGANFRSVPAIVSVLNRIRPELPQAVRDIEAKGSVSVYHTNQWIGTRLSGAQWKDDLPPEVAHQYLMVLMERLKGEGWDFSPEKTKILMLTHNILAKEQGYGGIGEAFQGKNERFIKKEDPHIAFLTDTLEPICVAYEEKHFGEMFAEIDGHAPPIHSYIDKLSWMKDMDSLLKLRSTGTIGAVIDHLKTTARPHLPDEVERQEQIIGLPLDGLNSEQQAICDTLNKLRSVPYKEIIALARFIDEKTPFSTKHGVKGAEFENVLVVFGRGWNIYDFNQMLEWAVTGIPSGKTPTFERNRNLFYVVCSRPKKRLALLFTQKLSDKAKIALSNWFGEDFIHSMD